MCFRLVSNSVTLNDLERRNGRVVCFFSPNSVAVCAYYVKMVEDHRHILRVQCSLNYLVFSAISLTAIYELRRGSPQRGR